MARRKKTSDSPLQNSDGSASVESAKFLGDACSMGFLVSSVTRHFQRAVDRELRTLGITSAQLAPLLALSEVPSMLQRDLVKRLGVTQPAMVGPLAKLERDALIERRPDQRDGRASLISLTEGGRALVEAARPALKASNDRALAGFSGDEQKALAAYLLRIAHALYDGALAD